MGRVLPAWAVAMAGGDPLPTPTPTATPTPTPTPTPSPSPTPTFDTVTPNVNITSPSNGSTLLANTSVHVNASDNIGVKRVELYADGALVATSKSAPFTMKWNTNKAVAGSHVLQAKAYDSASNMGTSALVTVYK